MTRVLILGPGEWDPAKGPPSIACTPMGLRRLLAGALARRGVEAILMEDVPDRADEDILEKFRRLVTRPGFHAVVVVWPPRAKMQTTFDELVLLREWQKVIPPV